MYVSSNALLLTSLEVTLLLWLICTQSGRRLEAMLGWSGGLILPFLRHGWSHLERCKACLILYTPISWEGNSYAARNKSKRLFFTNSVNYRPVSIQSYQQPFWPHSKVPELLWRVWRQKLRFPAPTLVGFSARDAPLATF